MICWIEIIHKNEELLEAVVERTARRNLCSLGQGQASYLSGRAKELTITLAGEDKLSPFSREFIKSYGSI